MKKNSCGATLVLLLALVNLSCQNEDAVSPSLTAPETRSAVLGKWKIEKIDSQLCRSGNCNTTYYTGNRQDYFEFRQDSAFLEYNTTASYSKFSAFRAEYTLPGAFILTQEFWSARYIVREYKSDKVVLVCSYPGSDPYSKFTDTYYLYR